MKKIEVSAKTKRKLLIIISVVLAVILVLLVAATAYLESVLNLINKNPDDSTMSSSEYEEFLNNQLDPDYTGDYMDPDDIHWAEGPDLLGGAHIVNIMLVGQDRRPGEGRARSDVMILCTVNTDTKELTLTSFMRDMYVQIPGYSDNKMNAAYAFGGMKLLDKCLQTNFGVQVDGMMEVDFSGFEGVIDLLGGVDLELSRSEANFVNNLTGYNLVEGMNHLDGKAALMYARNRSTGNADFDRTGRQRKVLGAVIEKCKGKSVLELNTLLTKALPMITTDMSNREIMNYMMALVPMLGSMKVNNQRIPADGTFSSVYFKHAGSTLVPDLEANRELLKICMQESN